MKIGVVVRTGRSEVSEVAANLQALALARDIAVAMVTEDVRPGDPEATDLSDCDAIIAVGGDGTVLEAAQYGLVHDLPILGVNVGRVGFLAEADPEDLGAVVALIESRAWVEVPRMTVEAELEDGSKATGLNDVVVEKTRSQRLVSLELLIDGERFLTYRADGLVFAAPTGSTAYNLSAGGPIVDPAIDALIVTPVAPYSMFARTLVLPPDTVVTCTVAHDRPAGVNVDGFELGVVQPGESVWIRRGAGRVRFIKPGRRSYSQTVKSKLRLYEGLDGASF
ncbi:MAG: NAD(+)/NADH kinase [Acidimicrobiia bacterium]|nr:NAD(+)/NADH kinase [Acidimicrobiia bacterium]